MGLREKLTAFGLTKRQRKALLQAHEDLAEYSVTLDEAVEKIWAYPESSNQAGKGEDG